MPSRIIRSGKPISFADDSYPRMYFVEHKYAGDPTNWWIPNRACAEAMLRSAGFEIVAHPEDEVFICRRTAGDAVARCGNRSWPRGRSGDDLERAE